MFKLKPLVIIALATLVVTLTVVVVFKTTTPSQPAPSEAPSLPGDQALMKGTDFVPNPNPPGILDKTDLAKPD